MHHDGGAVGAAVPLGVWKERFKKLKEVGVNAIRTSHNPVAPEFLDLCDQMGFGYGRNFRHLDMLPNTMAKKDTIYISKIGGNKIREI